MIAPKELPEEYEAWNRRWHAPFGKRVPFGGALSRSRPALWFRGPFAVQPNSETRRFEYPWAWEQLQHLSKGSAIVEIGGGLSGFQFVLSREGFDVTNVDPGLAAKGRGWAASPEKHRSLSRLFRAPVKLLPTVLEETDLAAQSVDAVVSISTLEHLTPADIAGVASAVRRILKPNGVMVMTVDLFLDVRPFTSQERNRWGTNVDIRAFLEQAGLGLVAGDRKQLFGFPEFDPVATVRSRHSFSVGGRGVALAQCLVAAPVKSL